MVNKNLISNIRYKLLGVWLLNIIDLLSTWYVLKVGCGSEGNILLQDIINNPFLSATLKIGLIGSILYILYTRLKDATLMQIRLSNWVVTGVLGFYIWVCYNNISIIVQYINYIS